MLPTFNLRMILWAALAMALLMNYTAWQAQFPPPPQEVAASAPAGNGAANGAAPGLGSAAPVISAAPIPQAPAPGASATPAGSLASTAPQITIPGSAPAAGASLEPAAPTVHVVTDVLDVLVSLQG